MTRLGHGVSQVSHTHTPSFLVPRFPTAVMAEKVSSRISERIAVGSSQNIRRIRQLLSKSIPSAHTELTSNEQSVWMLWEGFAKEPRFEIAKKA